MAQWDNVVLQLFTRELKKPPLWIVSDVRFGSILTMVFSTLPAGRHAGRVAI
jgi:hypothetical protein